MAADIAHEREGMGHSAMERPEKGSDTDSRDLDDNYKVFEASQDIETSKEEAKKVLSKIDRRVVPILFGTYMLQYLDKNSLNFASVYGLQEGTHLHGQDYAWLGKLPFIRTAIHQILIPGQARFSTLDT